jgi:hypothetical protein
MRVINRTAITVIGAQPYIDWTKTRDAAFAPEKAAGNRSAGDGGGLSVSVPRAKPFGSAYLLPEGVEEEDLLKTFREWFRVDLHGVVVDVADDEIDGEDI